MRWDTVRLLGERDRRWYAVALGDRWIDERTGADGATTNRSDDHAKIQISHRGTP